jgi:hypothetical protein
MSITASFPLVRGVENADDRLDIYIYIENSHSLQIMYQQENCMLHSI